MKSALQLCTIAMNAVFRWEEIRESALHLLNKKDRINKVGGGVTIACITNILEFRLRKEGPLRRTPLRYRRQTLQEAYFLSARFRSKRTLSGTLLSR